MAKPIDAPPRPIGRATPDAPHGGVPEYLKRIESPIGRIELVSDGAAIVSLAIDGPGGLPWAAVAERTIGVLDAAAGQLDEYFAGRRDRFDVPVLTAGTAFQAAVWAELRLLAFGRVASYGELGLATGRVAAGRAVGGAVGRNPVPILIPCHRVLGIDMTVTGYSMGAGIPTKIWLLDHEGIDHR